MLDQVQEGVEDARRERHDLTGGSPEQQSLRTIEPELAELENLGRWACHHDSLPADDGLILLSDRNIPTFRCARLLALARVQCNSAFILSAHLTYLPGMSDATPASKTESAPELRAPAYIGPLIPAELWPLRYVGAIVVVFATVGLRAALAPLLGTQAPLLPFVLAVFVSAYLGGRGPGLLASVLTPVAATIWFTAWPHDAPPVQWASHVLFFLLIAALATLIMHELQRSTLAQLAALRATADSEEQVRKTASQLKLIADAMPALISYIGPDGTYRFSNKLYESWFGIPSDQVVGRHLRDVVGAEAFELVRPRLERALKGRACFSKRRFPTHPVRATWPVITSRTSVPMARCGGASPWSKTCPPANARNARCARRIGARMTSWPSSDTSCAILWRPFAMSRTY